MVSIKTDYVINPGTAKTVGHILVIHATADNGATAANIAAYEHRTWRSAFVHYAVDDKGAYQIGKPGYKAYGAGNVNRYAPVQIELCQFTDKTRARKAYSNFVALVKQMAAKHGIPLTLDDSNRTKGIKSHDWCRKTYGGTTHTDPWSYLTSIGISKAQFAKDLKAKTTASKPAAAKSISQLADEVLAGKYGSGDARKKALGSKFAAVQAEVNRKLGAKKTTSKRVAQKGKWTARTTVLVRSAPSKSAESVAKYYKGESVKYDSYIDADGISWCSYVGASGKRRYVARRTLDNKHIYADAY